MNLEAVQQEYRLNVDQGIASAMRARGAIQTLSSSFGPLQQQMNLMGLGWGAVGVAALNAGMKVESATTLMQLRTVATGATLRALRTDFEHLAQTAPGGLYAIADTLTIIKQRTDMTVAAAEGMAAKVLKVAHAFSESPTMVTRDTAAMMNAWHTSTGVLDKVTVAAQRSGAPLRDLMRLMTEHASPLRNLGFNINETLTMMVNAEKLGLPAERVMTALAQASQNLHGNRQALDRVFAEIRSGHLSQTQEFEVAHQIFGMSARFGGAQMLDLIKQGGMDVRGMAGEFDKAAGAADRLNDTSLRNQFGIQFQQVELMLSKMSPALLEMGHILFPIVSQVTRLVGAFAGNTVVSHLLGWSMAFAAMRPAISGVTNMVAGLAGVNLKEVAIAGFDRLTVAIRGTETELQRERRSARETAAAERELTAELERQVVARAEASEKSVLTGFIGNRVAGPLTATQQRVVSNMAASGKIPKFAEGGEVTEPTLALIGEAGPEVVIPRSSLDDTVRMLATQSVIKESQRRERSSQQIPLARYNARNATKRLQDYHYEELQRHDDLLNTLSDERIGIDEQLGPKEALLAELQRRRDKAWGSVKNYTQTYEEKLSRSIANPDNKSYARAANEAKDTMEAKVNLFQQADAAHKRAAEEVAALKTRKEAIGVEMRETLESKAQVTQSERYLQLADKEFIAKQKLAQLEARALAVEKERAIAAERLLQTETKVTAQVAEQATAGGGMTPPPTVPPVAPPGGTPEPKGGFNFSGLAGGINTAFLVAFAIGIVASLTNEIIDRVDSRKTRALGVTAGQSQADADKIVRFQQTFQALSAARSNLLSNPNLKRDVVLQASLRGTESQLRTTMRQIAEFEKVPSITSLPFDQQMQAVQGMFDNPETITALQRKAALDAAIEKSSGAGDTLRQQQRGVWVKEWALKLLGGGANWFPSERRRIARWAREWQGKDLTTAEQAAKNAQDELTALQGQQSAMTPYAAASAEAQAQRATAQRGLQAAEQLSVEQKRVADRHHQRLQEIQEKRRFWNHLPSLVPGTSFGDVLFAGKESQQQAIVAQADKRVAASQQAIHEQQRLLEEANRHAQAVDAQAKRLQSGPKNLSIAEIDKWMSDLTVKQRHFQNMIGNADPYTQPDIIAMATAQLNLIEPKIAQLQTELKNRAADQRLKIATPVNLGELNVQTAALQQTLANAQAQIANFTPGDGTGQWQHWNTVIEDATAQLNRLATAAAPARERLQAVNQMLAVARELEVSKVYSGANGVNAQLNERHAKMRVLSDLMTGPMKAQALAQVDLESETNRLNQERIAIIAKARSEREGLSAIDNAYQRQAASAKIDAEEKMALDKNSEASKANQVRYEEAIAHAIHQSNQEMMQAWGSLLIQNSSYVSALRVLKPVLMGQAARNELLAMGSGIMSGAVGGNGMTMIRDATGRATRAMNTIEAVGTGVSMPSIVGQSPAAQPTAQPTQTHSTVTHIVKVDVGLNTPMLNATIQQQSLDQFHQLLTALR